MGGWELQLASPAWFSGWALWWPCRAIVLDRTLLHTHVGLGPSANYAVLESHPPLWEGLGRLGRVSEGGTMGALAPIVHTLSETQMPRRTRAKLAVYVSVFGAA